MLDHERYMLAKRASTIYALRYNVPQDYFGYLLSEHELTIRALEPLGPNYKNPDQIPFINQVIAPHFEPSNEYKSKPLLIEVAGLPNTEKTSLANAVKRIYRTGVRVLQEPYQFAKAHKNTVLSIAKGDRTFATEAEEINKAIIAAIFPHAAIFRHPQTRLLIADRGAVDQPIFAKTKTLAGMSYNPGLENPYLRLQDTAKNKGLYCYGLILCITTPSIVIARKTEGENIGKYTNPGFLGLLYDQYVRFYSELLKHRNEIFFPFACLDTSSPNFEVNLQTFRETIINMGKFYGNNFH